MPISPPSPLTVYKNTVVLLTAAPAGAWSATSGTLWSNQAATVAHPGGATSSVYWKAPNANGSVTISCTGNTSLTVAVTSDFPAVPNYPYQITPAVRGVQLVERRDGSFGGRVLGDGVARMDYKLTFRNRRLWEYLQIVSFWKDNYPEKKFVYTDRLTGVSANFQFASPVVITGRSSNLFDFEVEIREVP